MALLNDLSTFGSNFFKATGKKLTEIAKPALKKVSKDSLINTFAKVQEKAEKLPFIGPAGKELSRVYQEGSDSIERIGSYFDPLKGVRHKVLPQVYKPPTTQVPKLSDYGKAAKLGLTAAGTVMTPGYAIASAGVGAGINTAITAGSNIINRRKDSLYEAAQEGSGKGFISGAAFGPFGKFSNPALTKLLKDTPAGKIGGERIAQGLANVAEGYTFATSIGDKYTLQQAAIDFGVGASMKPFKLPKPVLNQIRQMTDRSLESQRGAVDFDSEIMRNKYLKDTGVNLDESPIPKVFKTEPGKPLGPGAYKPLSEFSDSLRAEVDNPKSSLIINTEADLKELSNVASRGGFSSITEYAQSLGKSFIKNNLDNQVVDVSNIKTVADARVKLGRSTEAATSTPPARLPTDQSQVPSRVPDSTTPSVKSSLPRSISNDIIEVKPGVFVKKSEAGFFRFNSETQQLETDPVIKKVMDALESAKPIRKAQEALYSAERSKRLGKVVALGKQIPGEAGFHAQLGALKGELPKAEFESIRKAVTQTEVDTLFQRVNDSPLLAEFQKINAKTGLAKMFDGSVPTKGELKLLNRVYGPEFVQTLLDKRRLLARLTEGVENALNIPRSIMTSIDFSGSLRQGVVLAAGHPKKFAKAFVKQFGDFASEDIYRAGQEEIIRRPTFSLMEENKLALSGLDDVLSNREEAFASSFAEQIPLIGPFVRASSRAYTGLLNRMRADVFDDFVRMGKESGAIDDPKYLEDAAKYINTASGRGSLGAFESAAQGLNAVFFSPRLMASRLQQLNPAYYVNLHPAVRKEALKSMLTFTGVALSALGLAKLGGAKVGMDSNSADYGKIKIRNTRIDPWAGFQQYVRAASQLISGKYVSSTTGKQISLGEGYKPLTRFDILLRQLESKQAPVASFITNWLQGTSSTGEKFKLSKELKDRFTPMVINDLYELYQEEGPMGLLLGSPAIFGVGVQTYGGAKPEVRNFLKGGDVKELLKLDGFDLNGIMFHSEFKKMPREQANQLLDQIETASKSPEFSTREKNKLKDILREVAAEGLYERNQITSEERGMVGSPVESRVEWLIKKLNNLTTKEEKNSLLDRYETLGILTDTVSEELAIAKRDGKLK